MYPLSFLIEFLFQVSDSTNPAKISVNEKTCSFNVKLTDELADELIDLNQLVTVHEQIRKINDFLLAK